MLSIIIVDFSKQIDKTKTCPKRKNTGKKNMIRMRRRDQQRNKNISNN